MSSVVIRVGGECLQGFRRGEPITQWIEWEVYPRNESGGNSFHDATSLKRCQVWGNDTRHQPFRITISFEKMRKMIRAFKKRDWRNANRKYLHIAYPDKY